MADFGLPADFRLRAALPYWGGAERRTRTRTSAKPKKNKNKRKPHHNWVLKTHTHTHTHTQNHKKHGPCVLRPFFFVFHHRRHLVSLFQGTEWFFSLWLRFNRVLVRLSIELIGGIIAWKDFGTGQYFLFFYDEAIFCIFFLIPKWFFLPVERYRVSTEFVAENFFLKILKKSGNAASDARNDALNGRLLGRVYDDP